MVDLIEGKLLWTPSESFREKSRIAAYASWLAERRGLRFDDYHALWNWSVAEIEDFWASVWDYFDIRAAERAERVLAERVMPGARWFEGARLNAVDQIFRHAEGEDAEARAAIVYASEGMPVQSLSWRALRARAASLASALREIGVKPGDRVAAIMPNIPETIVTFLGSASVGAIWSLCSPDMGERAVLDRFRQIEPKVLVAVDGYRYAGKVHDRTDLVRDIRASLPSVETLVILPRLGTSIDGTRFKDAQDWRDLAARNVPLQTEVLPFDHPLWVVYSSGTTGLPKPIVHGHGGILLEQVMMSALHGNHGPGTTVQWYTSAGWIMWNAQLGCLAVGATIALYDGGPAFPDLGVLWRFAEAAGVTAFGSGAAYFGNCAKAGLRPAEIADLSRLTAISSTGSPLSAEAYDWIYSNVKSDVWLAPISGGTDFAGAFIVGVPTLPVYAGEMQARALGHKVEAFDEAGRSVIDQVGELVCTEPVPSMPLYFWNDPGNRRYLDSYFDVYPGVWRHGDWIKITRRGGAVIYGRSDATVNRYGIRMGTSEFYRVVEEFPEVADSLVVDLEFLGRESFLYLFVVMKEGRALDDRLRGEINARLREALSPRHVPNAVVQAPAVPYTLSGKKLEVPVKKMLLGQPPEAVANRGALANPEIIDWYAAFAAERSHAASG